MGKVCMLINFCEFRQIFTNISKPLLICSLLSVMAKSRLLFRYFITILGKPLFICSLLLLHFKIKFTHFIWKPFNSKTSSHKGTKIFCIKISIFRLKNTLSLTWFKFCSNHLHLAKTDGLKKTWITSNYLYFTTW